MKYFLFMFFFVISIDAICQRPINIKTIKDPYDMAYMYLIRGQYDSTLKIIDSLIANEPNKDHYYLKSKIYYHKNNYDSLDKYLKKALVYGYDTISFYKEYVDFFELKRRNNKKAIEYLNKIIEIKPDSSQLYLERSGLKITDDDIDGALNDLNKAANLGNEEAKERLKERQKRKEYLKEKGLWQEE